MDDYEEDEGEENEVLNLTDHLKKLLHISTVPPPYDVPNDLNDMLNSDDTSSDDDQGVAMQVISESDEDEVEIDPYWCKIVVDELQGLGNPTIVDEMNTDPDMPDLQSVGLP